MKDVPLEIRYRRRTRRVTLRVMPDRKIRVTAPYRVSQKQIQEIVLEKQKWILRRLQLLEEQPEVVTFKFVDDEFIPFYGEKLVLKIVADCKDAIRNGAYLYASDESAVKLWYRSRSLELLRARVAYYSEKLGVGFHSISVKNYKARWGACSSKGELAFNWQIVCFSPELFDYVVAHEICHLKEMNHGPRFYGHLDALGFARLEYHARMRPLKNFF